MKENNKIVKLVPNLMEIEMKLCIWQLKAVE